MQRKEVGNVDTFPYIINGKSYNIMALTDPDYVILIITKYGTLENWRGQTCSRVTRD